MNAFFKFLIYKLFQIHFSFIFKDINNKQILTTCLQYWLKIWYNIEKSIESRQNQKHLVEMLLKTIIEKTDISILQDFNNKFENFEIILLKSGQHSNKLEQYFQQNFIKYLNKLQDRNIKRLTYKELVSSKRLLLHKIRYTN